MFRFVIMCGAAAAFTTTAIAQDADDGWAGEASLNAAKTTGNTDTTDVGLGLKLAKDFGLWTHKLDASADYGKVDGSENKNRFALGYQVDRDINDRTYLYVNGDYFQDEFGAYKSGYFVGTGAGYKLIQPEPIGWNVEGGVGFRSQKSRLAPGTPGGAASVRTEEVALRALSDFDYAFNENVSLYNDSEIIWSDSDTYLWNEVGITATLMGNLAARASFRVDHHTDVPVGRENTDTATRFGVVYKLD